MSPTGSVHSYYVPLEDYAYKVTLVNSRTGAELSSPTMMRPGDTLRFNFPTGELFAEVEFIEVPPWLHSARNTKAALFDWLLRTRLWRPRRVRGT